MVAMTLRDRTPYEGDSMAQRSATQRSATLSRRRPRFVAGAAAVAAGVGAALVPLQATPASAAAAPDSVRDKIVQSALDELQKTWHNVEAGAYNCNYYTGVMATWASSAGCPMIDGVQYRTQEWCADFAKFTWKVGGAKLDGVTPAAASFYSYGVNNGTWDHTPNRGDAAVFNLNSNGTWAAHVAVVTTVESGGFWAVGGNTGADGQPTDRVYKKHYTTASGFAGPAV
jgi:hypothetical protein